jgi:hypothetical protein
MNLTHNTIDDTLRDFYRSEMPDPWPTMRAPARTLPLPKRTARPVWLRSLSRLAVAASIAMLLIGYLALASLFPRENGARPGLPSLSGDLGNNPDHGPKKHQPKAPIRSVDERPRNQRIGATIDTLPGGEQIFAPKELRPR